AFAALRGIALEYPEAYEEFPWGHTAIKVHKKIFLTLGDNGADGLSMSLKLPQSRYEALALPFTEPTHYGMGKHGWVTARFAVTEQPPIDLLADWIDESYRAVAPTRLVARLDDESPE
ncbi:MAG: MmcQ/YjbR family DNA-binding protein, partial [Planctomycetes bacterium]|nr:MmcQ/YjbR family DNA-binding protein [Planctomycetota bacterium]